MRRDGGRGVGEEGVQDSLRRVLLLADEKRREGGQWGRRVEEKELGVGGSEEAPLK